MEWTKETLRKTCIEVKNVSQSNRILKFYQSFGYFMDTKQNWKCPKSMVGGFIGPSTLYKNNIVHLYWPDSVSELQIIKLPVTPRRKFPREMWVSIDNVNWYKKLVFGKVKNHYAYIAEYSTGSSMGVSSWKYAKEIDDRTAS